VICGDAFIPDLELDARPVICGHLHCRARHDWRPDQWAGRARMATARHAAGVPLDDLDRQALHTTTTDPADRAAPGHTAAQGSRDTSGDTSPGWWVVAGAEEFGCETSGETGGDTTAPYTAGMAQLHRHQPGSPPAVTADAATRLPSVAPHGTTVLGRSSISVSRNRPDQRTHRCRFPLRGNLPAGDPTSVGTAP